MIRYTLACARDHRFDSWFLSGAAFDHQSAAGLVSCPVCGSAHVRKDIMAPAVLGARTTRSGRGHEPSADQAPCAEAAATPTTDVTLLDPRARDLRAAITRLRDSVLATAEDVGGQFPDEARRMHEGEIPYRQIHGRATLEEARDLLDDGILVLPLPGLPEDMN